MADKLPPHTLHKSKGGLSMAIVMSGTASNGAKWRIHDDAYINNTPEQNEALRRRACEVAYNALVQHVKANGGENNAENRRDDRNGQRKRLV